MAYYNFKILGLQNKSDSVELGKGVHIVAIDKDINNICEYSRRKGCF